MLYYFNFKTLVTLVLMVFQWSLVTYHSTLMVFMKIRL